MYYVCRIKNFQKIKRFAAELFGRSEYALQPYLHYCDSLLLIAAVVSVLQLAKGTDDSNCCGFQENH